MPPCAECQAIAAGTPRALTRGPFVVHARLEPGKVAGWMVVAPRRHVEQIDELGAAEQALLGPLVADVARALRAETAPARVYVAAFGEALPHLHVHVIARPEGLPPGDRGAAVFAEGASVDEGQARAVAGRVLDRLAASDPSTRSSATSPPLRAALLSALVCPGAGQIKNGEHAKGYALVAVTLAGAGYILVKLVRLVLAALPPDGIVDPLAAPELAMTLAAEAHADLSWLVAGLTLLWAYSTVDAWFGAARQATRTGASAPQR
jgi:diadenosine tetraphosphate (Ap4A) HIT family hydrolase